MNPIAHTGRMFQDVRFVVPHVRERGVEALLGVVAAGQDDLKPALILLKPEGQPWQKLFLDAGLGFYEQWHDLDPAEHCDGGTHRCVDYMDLFSLRPATIREIECEPVGENPTSRILLRLTSGELELRPEDPAVLDSPSVVSWRPEPAVSSTIEQELIDVSDAWDRAMITNDADAIGLYMADDWTIIGPDGSVGDKASFLEPVRSGKLTHDVMESHDLKVRVYGDIGDTAVVTGRGISGGQYQGQSFYLVERTSCVFVRQQGRWRCVLTHLSLITEK